VTSNTNTFIYWKEQAERLQRLADQRLEHIRSESSRLVQIDVARNKAEAKVERLQDTADDLHGRLILSEQEAERLRAALEPAMEWAAGYPLGGGMDERAAADVYERARAALTKEDR